MLRTFLYWLRQVKKNFPPHCLEAPHSADTLLYSCTSDPKDFMPFPDIKLILRDHDSLPLGRFSGTGCGQPAHGLQGDQGPARQSGCQFFRVCVSPRCCNVLHKVGETLGGAFPQVITFQSSSSTHRPQMQRCSSLPQQMQSLLRVGIESSMWK